MRKVFLATVALLMVAFSANAQVQIESPHPDFNVKITRCANSNGTVIIDMVLTNYGADEKVRFYTSSSLGDITVYDDEGNIYTHKNSKMSLGIISQGLSNYAEFVMPQDVPLKFRVEFQSISNKASKFSLVNMLIESSGAMALKISKPLKIKNLEWVK